MNQLRIIGGAWKRRIIRFESIEGLRPTPDRVRETLFNWLMWDVAGRRVLDLCAGSGALGLEALSRGAIHCTLIEPNKQQAIQLQRTLSELQSDLGKILNLTAQNAASKVEGTFDLLFLDPPYSLNLWAELAQLYDGKLSERALIYVEADRAFETLGLPAHWELKKQTKAGSVVAGLFERKVV
ncbi:MAG: 16S rRNA (guanine(966)-N(2))-methyltransferase RsmD [Candidatus Saccharibacteria bacterium]|nr:16S rRNA (guanine(966)-N(2))-methyltransferase RsmD [Moraxellaceae bacterium]